METYSREEYTSLLAAESKSLRTVQSQQTRSIETLGDRDVQDNRNDDTHSKEIHQIWYSIREVSKIVRRMAAGFGGCSAALTYAGLTASGDLLPCVPAAIKLGNLLEQDLKEIWIHNQLLNYIRDRNALKGSCKACAFGDLCGGCRFTGYVTQGDWLGPDTSCPFGPKR